MINKSQLLEHILVALESVHKNAVDAAMLAYQTATHEENVAENKYDTLGLEASYLAQGQAQRVAECEADLTVFKKLIMQEFSALTPIALSALIYLKGINTKENSLEKILFLGPAAGGLQFDFNNQSIILISPSAPLGKTLMGRYVGDEVEIVTSSQKIIFEIVSVY